MWDYDNIMPNTIFRPVPGYTDLYAGMDGTIVHGGKGELKQMLHKGQRYLRVRVPGAGKEKVHQLVAAAFLGPRPDGIETRHVDGDRFNNHLSNLCYGTRLDNAQDAVHHGTLFNALKTECPQGHPYSPENTYVASDGARQCRICRLARNQEYSAKPEARERLREYQREYQRSWREENRETHNRYSRESRRRKRTKEG